MAVDGSYKCFLNPIGKMMNKESTGKSFCCFLDNIVVIQIAVFILSNVISVTLSFKTDIRKLIPCF